MVKRRSLAYHFVGYSATTIGIKLISMALVPFYLRLFTQSDYGTLEMARSIALLGGVVLSLGLPQSFQVNYNSLTQDGRSHFVMMAFSISFAVGVPASFCFVVLVQVPIGDLNTEFRLAIALFVLSSFVQTMLLLFFQLGQNVSSYVQVQVIGGVSAILFSALCVLLLHLSILFVLLGDVTGMFLSSGYGIWKASRSGLRFDWPSRLYRDDAIRFIREGLALIPSQAAYYLLSQIDRWSILFFLGMPSVGLYSVAMRFSLLLQSAAITPLINTMSADLLKEYRTQSARAVLLRAARVTTLSCLSLILLIGLGYLLAGRLFTLIVTERFARAFLPFVILSIGQVIYLASQIMSVLLVHKRRVGSLSTVVFIAAVVNIVGNVVLVPVMGIAGAAIATTLSYLAWLVAILIRILLELRQDGRVYPAK